MLHTLRRLITSKGNAFTEWSLLCEQIVFEESENLAGFSWSDCTDVEQEGRMQEWELGQQQWWGATRE